MTDEEATAVLAQLDVGAVLRVPLRTPLYPETEALRSTLEVVAGRPDHFVLRTHFREFWAGHGWSLEQVEEQHLTREELRARLASVPVEACVREPGAAS